ncbi:MAG: FG-GAP-like repeat-containing protein [Acidobacteriaceae bacterium]|nr:FG-GAP-like repeat-containing protein [Acidobacteriaceae bacterium]
MFLCSSRGAKMIALLSSVFSGFAVAQKPVHVMPVKEAVVPAALAKYQTPAQRSLIPFLKAHPLKALNSSSLHTQDATSYVATPKFGGYVNAPMYDARTTASLATGTFNNGVTVELTGDFNKDGKQDIATLQQDGTMNILLHDSANGLVAPVSYYNPNYASSSVDTAYAVDVNNDGYLDIVAFDDNNDTMITWLNLQNGTFNAAVTSNIDTSIGYPDDVTVADINGDGKPDLIYAMSAFVSRSKANIYVETMLGNGDGTFKAPSSQQTQVFPVAASVQLPLYSLAIADINGDGKPDIALAMDERLTQTTGQYVVTTALGNGDGTFGTLGQTTPISAAAESANNLTVHYDSAGVSFADVTGDGKIDLISSINGVLEVAPGNGDGTFGAAVGSDFSAIASPSQLVFADLNGDGKQDAVVGGGTLAVYLGNGDGTFAAPTTAQQYITDPTAERGLVVGDFNSDGVTDIASMGGDYKQVSLFFGNGKGQLAGAPVVTSNADPNGINWFVEATGKYTTSGYSDGVFIHATTSDTEIVTGVNDGKGGFNFVTALSGGIPSDFEYIQPVHADLNGDGKEDLVLTGTAGSVTVALSNGDGTFSSPVSIGLPTQACPMYYAAAGDVNGDGNVDLIIPYGGDIACNSAGNGASGYYVALGKGDGTFASPVFTASGTELYSATLADINNDGKLDLVLDDAPFASGSGYNVAVALGNGDGTFAESTQVISNYLVSNVAVGDINGDGKADLVLSSEEVQDNDVSTGGILLLTGNGDGTFNSSSQIATGNFFFGLQLADMNNDGNQDIVATLYSTNGQPKNYYGMVTLLGLGNGQFSSPVNSLESLDGQTPMVGNFYGDNALDVMTSSGYGPALFIGQGSSSLSLAASASEASFGSSEVLTATLSTSMTGRPTATGSVNFYDGSTLLGTGDLANGTATLTTASLAVGSHSVTAVYSGDTNFNPAKASAVAITIDALTPAFTLAGTPATLTLSSGNNGVVSLSLAANASFSGAVTLSCTGAPANGTCTINPGTVTLSAGGTTTATLVIGTTTAKAELHRSSNPWETTGAVATLATLCGVFFGRRKRARMFAALGLGVMLSLGTLLTGCSDGSSVKSTGKTSFTVTVTATPASGSSVAAQSTTVNVTVQ